MGAHLSTIQASLKERFQQLDGAKQGYLTLAQLMAMQPQFGVSSCHLGVMWLIDRNMDAVFTLDELREFAVLAHSYARIHRSQEAAFMVCGYASLKLWAALQTNPQQVLDWLLSLLLKDNGTACLLQTRKLLVYQGAAKALYALFDMERNHNISYQALRQMMQQAAIEEQLLPDGSPLLDKWVPVEVLQLFLASLVEGMGSMMESCSSDAAELKEIVRRADAALAEQGRMRGRSSSSGGPHTLTPLNLKKQLYSSSGTR